MTKYYLFFDFSSEMHCIKALDKDFQELYCENFGSNKNLIELINPKINKVLKHLGIDWQFITRIYFNIGPGNFTGIRATVSVCKTIKMVYPHINLYYQNSLFLKCCGNGISLIFAGGEKSYFAIYENNHELVAPQILFNTEIDKYLKKYNYLKCYDANYRIDFALPNSIYKSFQLVDDLLELEPLYIKDPI